MGALAILAVLALAGSASGQSVVFSDDFNDGEIDEDRWPSTNGFSEDANCGYVSAPFAFNTGGNQLRQATTAAVDVQTGGTIEFAQRFGTSGVGGGCNDLATRNVELQYSTDGGTSWTTFAVYEDSGTRTEWTHTQEPIPPAAWTSHTKFRWTQGHVWGQHWAMDDLSIHANEQPVTTGPDTATVTVPDQATNVSVDAASTPEVTVEGCTGDPCTDEQTIPGRSASTPSVSTPPTCLPGVCVDPITVRSQDVSTDPVTLPAPCDVQAQVCFGPTTVLEAQQTPDVTVSVAVTGAEATLAGLSSGPGIPTQVVSVPGTPLTDPFEITICEQPSATCQLPGEPAITADGEATVTVTVGDQAVQRTVPLTPS